MRVLPLRRGQGIRSDKSIKPAPLDRGANAGLIFVTKVGAMLHGCLAFGFHPNLRLGEQSPIESGV